MFKFLTCIMRRAVSCVKSGLKCLLLPCGMQCLFVLSVVLLNFVICRNMSTDASDGCAV